MTLRLAGRNVCVTGGTGTFGRAFTRMALSDGAARIVVFSRDEWKQAQMSEDIAESYPEPNALRFMLGDVRDRDRLALAFRGLDVVVHAAALKRIDAVAYDPEEVVKTNVLGTINVIRAAIEAGVERVIVLSSDKGVRAASIYGASKFLAEHYAVASNAYAMPRGCRVSAVRYGNVLGSRGAVVHRWRRQIEAGQPVTVTDPLATRFWMRIEDAVGLVQAALQFSAGGEVFVPKLRAMRLIDLAVALGATRTVNIRMRPGGEKLHEELLSPEELTRTVETEQVYIVRPELHPWCADPPWGDCPTLPAEFIYRSDRAERISIDEMRELLAAIPEEGT